MRNTLHLDAVDHVVRMYDMQGMSALYVENFLGHPVADGVTARELNRLSEHLEEARKRKEQQRGRGGPAQVNRLDGKPRRKAFPEPGSKPPTR